MMNRNLMAVSLGLVMALSLNGAAWAEVGAPAPTPVTPTAPTAQTTPTTPPTQVAPVAPVAPVDATVVSVTPTCPAAPATDPTAPAAGATCAQPTGYSVVVKTAAGDLYTVTVAPDAKLTVGGVEVAVAALPADAVVTITPVDGTPGSATFPAPAGQHDDGQQMDEKANDGEHNDGDHKDAQHENGHHEDGDHKDAQHENGHHEDGDHKDAQHENGHHEDGEHHDGQSAGSAQASTNTQPAPSQPVSNQKGNNED